MGQKVKYNKRKVFFLNISPRIKGRIIHIFNYKVANLLGTYLNMPLFKGGSQEQYGL